MHEMLKLQHNGLKHYKRGFPIVALSVLTQRKKSSRGEVWRVNWVPGNLPFRQLRIPLQGYLQFITHRESRALIFPLSKSTGWRARVQGGVFIKNNWATQLFTIFSKQGPICPSSSLDTLLLPFSPYQPFHNTLSTSICYLWSYFPGLQKRWWIIFSAIPW